GSVIALPEGDDYIWTHMYAANGDAMLLNMTRGWHVTVPVSESCEWEQVLDTESEGHLKPKVVGSDRVRQTIEHLNVIKNRAAKEELDRQTISRLEARLLDKESKIEEQQADWTKLNDHLNEYADNNTMCSDYERQLSDWNEDYSTLKLLGREIEYRVPVLVTVRYTGT